MLTYLPAGTDVVMTGSALLRHGLQHLGTLLDRGQGMAGGSRTPVPRPGQRNTEPAPNRASEALEPINYMQIPRGYQTP